MTIPDKSLKSLRVKNLHPTNLRNELSRCNYTYSEVEDLLSWNPELSRTVGSLPNGWIKGVNADGLKAGLTAKNIRGKNAQNFREVDEVLSKFATKFHDVKDGNYPSIQQVQDQLSKILNTEVKIQKLGSGCIGTAYKISAHGQDCVYKVFFNTPLVQAPGSHGNYPELLSALQAKNNHCKNFADFYMGKFGRNDDGYLLTRYIPEAETVVKTPSGRPKLFSDLLKKMSGSELIGANARNGIGLDYGATYLTEYTKLSPKAQKIARELFPALDGTSSENVSRIVQRYTGTAELEEVKTYINTFIQQQYHLYPKLLASRKHNLEQLGLDYKTDLRWIFGRNTDPKGFAMDYGLTEKQIQKLDVMWSEAHQSDHSDIACKLSMSILRWD